MKRILALITIVCFAQLSCNESGLSNPSLNGNWRMVSVTDNTSGAMTTKPSSIEGEVEINFVPVNETNGTFSGHTTINDLEGSYKSGEKETLTVDSLSMTQISETSWGNDFVDNFRNAQNYHFENSERLDIASAEKTLIFQKR